MTFAMINRNNGLVAGVYVKGFTGRFALESKMNGHLDLYNIVFLSADWRRTRKKSAERAFRAFPDRILPDRLVVWGK
jgi:hypothetical protein